MLAAVQDAFNEYFMEKIKDAFLTLQAVYDEIIKCRGNNTYKLPHLQKQKFRREGRLPTNLTVSDEAGEIVWLTNRIN